MTVLFQMDVFSLQQVLQCKQYFLQHFEYFYQYSINPVEKTSFLMHSKIETRNHFTSMHVLRCYMYTVSQKNDNDVVHYNFNAHQPILVIFGRYIAERTCY